MKPTRKEQERINRLLRELDIHHDQTKHLGCIRIHPTESKEHFLKKAELCYEMYHQRHFFLTEAWTSDRKIRFDAVNLETGETIEVVKTCLKDRDKNSKIVHV